jgi:hypothetical protein
MADTPATVESKLRVAVALAESLRLKRVNLSVALATSASTLHKFMKHGFHGAGDWRNCGEPECRAALSALLNNGEK